MVVRLECFCPKLLSKPSLTSVYAFGLMLCLQPIYRSQVDFSHSVAADTAMLGNLKVIRYQQNPTANWGPQAKAGRPAAKKAKLDDVQPDK